MNKSEKAILIAALLAYEPDYNFLATHGNRALPVLQDLINGDDARLAERATVLAARIGSEESLTLVGSVATDTRENVRAAVAVSTLRLPTQVAISILDNLLKDATPAIRRLAITSAHQLEAVELMPILREIEANDVESTVRDAATNALETLKVLDGKVK